MLYIVDFVVWASLHEGESTGDPTLSELFSAALSLSLAGIAASGNTAFLSSLTAQRTGAT